MTQHDDWKRHPSPAGFWIVDRGGDGHIVLTVHGTEAQGNMALAAPKLVSALLALLPHHAVVTTREEAEAVTAAREALIAAGVPLS